MGLVYIFFVWLAQCPKFSSLALFKNQEVLKQTSGFPGSFDKDLAQSAASEYSIQPLTLNPAPTTLPLHHTLLSAPPYLTCLASGGPGI